MVLHMKLTMVISQTQIKNESVSGKVIGINENIIEVQLEKNIGAADRI